MVFLILLLSVIYYASGFCCTHFLNIEERKIHSYDRSDFISKACWWFSAIGLGIIPIFTYWLKQIKDNTENYDICVIGSRKIDCGIIEVDNQLAYNFPEQNYMGIINIDVRKVSEKELDKIIKKLKEWATIEQRKQAKIKVISEFSR